MPDMEQIDPALPHEIKQVKYSKYVTYIGAPNRFIPTQVMFLKLLACISKCSYAKNPLVKDIEIV